MIPELRPTEVLLEYWMETISIEQDAIFFDPEYVLI